MCGWVCTPKTPSSYGLVWYLQLNKTQIIKMYPINLIEIYLSTKIQLFLLLSAVFLCKPITLCRIHHQPTY